jgi:hypothetical protein
VIEVLDGEEEPLLLVESADDCAGYLSGQPSSASNSCLAQSAQ